MILLNISHVNKFFGANEVFSDIDFQVDEGERIGLIGRNGVGKTTLFKMITGEENLNEGAIHKAKGVRIGWLEQIPVRPEGTTARAVLLEAFADLLGQQKTLRDMEAQMGVESGKALDRLMHDYDMAQKHFEVAGGYAMEEQSNRVIIGLKIEHLVDRPFDKLSGGEKTRIMLGKILLEAPDVLLLDEPTNHLDAGSVEWLEEYMTAYKGSMIIVSHDRFFMDKVTTKIVEIERGTSRTWKGNYTRFKEQKDEWLRQQLALYKNQQKKIREMEEAIKRFRDWGTRVDNEAMFVKAKSMEKRLERMEKVEKPKEDKRNMGLSFATSGRSGKEVLSVRDLSFGYDQALVRGASFELNRLERAALVGPNGVGKTTFLKLLVDQLEPMAGDLKLGAQIKVEYLEQETAFERPERTVIQLFNEETLIGEWKGREKLARFLFFGDDLHKPVSGLSGGEKVRLQLCLMMEQEVNFLLLDEPTNHVDIPSREMLELALQNFDGTVLFVSHDRYFMNQVATKVIELSARGTRTYEGNYDAYKAEQERDRQLGLQRQETSDSAAEEKADKNYRYQDEKRLRNAEKKRQRQLEKVEAAIAEMEAKIAAAEAKLNEDEGLPYDRVLEQYDAIKGYKAELDQFMEAWMDLQQ